MSQRLVELSEISSRTTVRVGVGVIIHDESGHILLEKRADCQKWGLVGGKVEPGQSIEATAKREAFEETGLEVQITKLLGVYSERYCRILRFEPSGDERHVVDVVVIAKNLSDSSLLRCSEESEHLAWFGQNELPHSSDFLRAAWRPVQDYWSGSLGVIG
jgi:8-oxo-dGTP pyrophosphatase MutT (NUDIX family)